MKSIIAGEQTQTVYKDTRELAKVASNMVDAVAQRQEARDQRHKTYDNGAKVVPAYLLEPVSVDKTNYQKVLVDCGYYTEADLK